ncbi:uncharacterized skeletal organic matrix protein 7-like [Nematostella vectensis]|uniref:uncharacterized skeletal organic matrix protein 7-like n=1 Tax=Nematostella vectensis TaxID=45351 RepID=UPI0020773CF8|nr:uncharacterized skeletal organic matrix protein 7-like [Nematostella vectensis]
MTSMPYYSRDCPAYQVNPDYIQMDASLTRTIVCYVRFLTSAASGVIGQPYTVSMDLRAWGHDNRTHFIFPGVICNIQDNDRYDVINFRIGYADNCIQSSYIRTGGVMVIDFTTGDCLLGSPLPNTWFTVSLSITQFSVTVYVNGAFAKTVTPHYPLRRQFGVAVINSYISVAEARNIKLE